MPVKISQEVRSLTQVNRQREQSAPWFSRDFIIHTKRFQKEYEPSNRNVCHQALKATSTRVLKPSTGHLLVNPL